MSDNTQSVSPASAAIEPLRPIKELLGMKFFIPSYQRGYRWTELQVEPLLKDINDFKRQKDDGELTKYCLQPLAVHLMDETDPRLNNQDDKKNWYEVIDGQQRLTTIYIILKTLDCNREDLPQIVYETRQDSGDFLKNIHNKSGDDVKNIDYHFMFHAKETIKTWRQTQNLTQQQTQAFINKLTSNCEVIWYETKEDAYEVFKRLNSGKLPLSNAELVKATLLKRDNFGGMIADTALLKQSEMAAEWDRMEQTLHNDSFWYFVNPEPEHARFDCTRIDFVLEMVLRCKGEYENTEVVKNDYYVFNKFLSLVNNRGWFDMWQDIQKYFRIMKAWYDNRELFHYIGYLMNCSGDNKTDTLCELLVNASNNTKGKFLKDLKENCANTILDKEKKACAFELLEYGKHNKIIHNILLLFNLATTQNQVSETSRYPFDKHFEAKKHRWSLEHIHAQNETKATWDKDKFTKIKTLLTTISTDGVKELVEFLKDKSCSDDIKDDVYKAIIGAFMGKKVACKNGVFSCEWEKDHHLTNMALLQGDKNAAFNNKLFPEKRETLAGYENAEQSTEFVPICTRNVFFKHYSPCSNNPFVWDKKAGEEYVVALTKTVAAYLGLNSEIKYEQEQGEESLISYRVSKPE